MLLAIHVRRAWAAAERAGRPAWAAGMCTPRRTRAVASERPAPRPGAGIRRSRSSRPQGILLPPVMHEQSLVLGTFALLSPALNLKTISRMTLGATGGGRRRP